MSTTYAGLTDTQLSYIETTIRKQTYGPGLLQNYFKKYGLIQNVPEGTLNIKIPEMKGMAPGVIVSELQELDVQAPRLAETPAIMMLLATKIKIPWLVIQRASASQFFNGDLINMAINEYMMKLDEQIESFMAWGDRMQVYNLNDKNVAQEKFKGFFNSYTSLAAGAGSDNNTAADGDYADVRCPVCEEVCATTVWLKHPMLLAETDAMQKIVAAVQKVCENAKELAR